MPVEANGHVLAFCNPAHQRMSRVRESHDTGLPNISISNVQNSDRQQTHPFHHNLHLHLNPGKRVGQESAERFTHLRIDDAIIKYRLFGLVTSVAATSEDDGSRRRC